MKRSQLFQAIAQAIAFMGAVLIVAGVQLVALGLLGELQVRHFHEPTKRAPYSVDRVLRTSPSESALAE